jgi:hypothetical protein
MTRTIRVAAGAFILLILLSTTPTSLPCAPQTKVKVGQIVVLDGVFIVAEGEDIQERPVKYEAIKLAEPITIVFEDGEDPNVKLMTLWLNKDQKNVFRRLLGKQVRVTGTVDYYWFGPSTMPNPAKLQVIDVRQR